MRSWLFERTAKREASERKEILFFFGGKVKKIFSLFPRSLQTPFFLPSLKNPTAYAKDPSLCRLMFFSEELPESEVERYVRLLKENDGETPVLDVRELPKQVPLPPLVSSSNDDKQIQWPWFVLGGTEDTIVDAEACRECAEWLGGNSSNDSKGLPSRSVTIEGLAHDSMLDARWREAADALLEWAEEV